MNLHVQPFYSLASHCESATPDLNTSASIVRFSRLLIVARHLSPRILIFAFDIERLILRAAIQNRLVAAQTDGDGIERGQQLLAQLLPLLVLGDRDFLDVADDAAVVNAAPEG